MAEQEWVQRRDRTEVLIRLKGETIRGIFLDNNFFKVVGTYGAHQDGDILEVEAKDIEKLQRVSPNEPTPENW
jgi:hypothetical protein